MTADKTNEALRLEKLIFETEEVIKEIDNGCELYLTHIEDYAEIPSYMIKELKSAFEKELADLKAKYDELTRG